MVCSIVSIILGLYILNTYSGRGDTIYSTHCKQHYSLVLRKFVFTNLHRAMFELGSKGLQASLLPIEPPSLFYYYNF